MHMTSCEEPFHQRRNAAQAGLSQETNRVQSENQNIEEVTMKVNYFDNGFGSLAAAAPSRH
jgi:hypothetical protein